MPQHANQQSFVKGDPRAILAGRKGGKHRRAHTLSTDYVCGYHAGARNARRHIRRWIQETQMAHFERPADSPFLRIALRLHGDQRKATTTAQRQSADERMAHFLRMAGLGGLDAWIASHDTDYDDSLAANPEDAA